MGERLKMETVENSSNIEIGQTPPNSYNINDYSIDGTKIILENASENDKIDFVVIDNGIYQDYILSFNEEHHPVLDIGKTPSQNLIIKGFEFSDENEEMRTGFSIESIDAEEFEVNPTDGSIECPNHLNSYSIVPIVYDLNGERRVSSPNISLHKISFNYGDFQTKVAIQAQAVEIRSRLRQIEAANQDCPPALLYYENEEYKGLIDQLNSLLDAEQQLNESGSSVGVSRAYVYQCKNPKIFILRNGIDDASNGVKWAGNRVAIKHNLNGVVKLIVDDSHSHSVSYTAKMIDDNTVELDFGRNQISEYTLALFKVR